MLQKSTKLVMVISKKTTLFKRSVFFFKYLECAMLNSRVYLDCLYFRDKMMFTPKTVFMIQFLKRYHKH